MPVQSKQVTLPAASVGLGPFPYTGTQGNGVGYFDDPLFGKMVYLSLDSVRTIGNASSGAAISASWCESLFTHFWDNYSQSQCPVLTSAGGASSRGANAAADWSANKRLTFPDFRGRAIIVAGTGSTLTARTKGASGGAETHTLGGTEIPSHNHTFGDGSNLASGGGITGFGSTRINASSGQITSSTGGGGSHNNMQPWAAEHLIISAGAR
ncbi:MAG: hypothetical protein WCA35_14350 [Kovacikia sp.]